MEQKVGVYHAPGDVRMEMAKVRPTDDGAIVIRVNACGICGSDVHRYQGHTPTAPGSVLGHEFAGIVEAVGINVTDISVGERVIVNPMDSELGQGGGFPGAFAQYVLVPNAVRGETVFPLPDDVSTETAALLEPFAVGLHAVARANPRQGQKAVVFGAGTIGLCVVLALKARGVTDIVVTDLSEKRLELARQFGATTINVAGVDVRAALIAHFGAAKIPFRNEAPDIDIVVDCAGTRKTFEDAIISAKVGGQVIVVASPLSPVEIWPVDILLRELSVIASYAYTKEDFHAGLDLVQSGEVNLTPLVTHRFKLDQLADAFAVQADAAVSVKVMVEMA